MMDNPDNVRSNLASLMCRRDVIEAELINLHSLLREQNVSMTEPLVDGEGYPRSDIDIYAVCHLRHEIIRKENDCKALTKEIEQNLYALHAEEKVSTSLASLNIQQGYSKPFARVDLVDQNSPAQKADLRVGDLIVKFGTLKYRNFENLSAVARLVTENLRKPIHVSVLRSEELVPLILIPDQWSGNGYLGCRIIPINI